MMDIDIEDRLIRKFGGKFRLTVLIQKRMLELLTSFSARALVKVEGDRANLRDIVFEEIQQGKIDLAPSEAAAPAVEDLETKEKKVAPATEAAEPIAEIFALDIKKIKEQRIEEMARLFEVRKDVPGELLSQGKRQGKLP